MLRWIGVAGLFLCLMAIVSCSEEKGSQEASQTPPMDMSATTDALPLDGDPVTVAGITFTPSSQWTDLGASGMRQAEFAYGPVAGEADSATLTVFYFGPDQGGSVEANIKRWIDQWTGPHGETAPSVSQNQMTIDSMPAHVVGIVGTFNAPVGRMMSGKTEAKENYRMAGLVLEGPQGNVFFKLTGPDATASKMIETFMAMTLAIEKA